MRIIIRLLAVIGFLTVVAVGLVAFMVFRFHSKPERIASNTVLRLDLDKPVSEQPEPFSQLIDGKSTTFSTVLTALKRGAADDRVKGLVVRTGDTTLGMGQVQELRDAVKAFRAKGKFAYAYAESFGEISGGTRAYYLSSAFDQIWLQPTGSLGLVGLRAEIPFFKGTLDKLGVEAQFGRRSEYKSAATQFTDTKLPSTDHEAEDAMLSSLYDQITAGIGQDRKMTPDAVKQVIDNGPYIGQAALDQHLIDKIGYRDEVEAAAKAKAGTDASMMDVANYAAASQVGETGTDVIALIRAIGPITGGSDSDNPFDNDQAVHADSMVKAIDEAARDSQVKAIVLRIDSPGGSGTASETIWRAVKRAEAAHKPVIVSMANVAASGGYYIACGADKIVADPATLTGSIGVFSGKFVMAGLFDKLGVSVDTLSYGKDADIDSTQTGFTPEQKQHFNEMLDDFYKTFVARVAEGRHMDPVKAEAIARGRVWTGEQAKERGLVDVLGGLDEAIAQARQAAGIAAGTPVVLRSFPPSKSPLEAIAALLSGGSTQGLHSLAALERLSALAPLLHRLDQFSQASQGGAVMQPVDIAD